MSYDEKWLKDQEEYQSKGWTPEKRKRIVFETCTQYWVFIPTITYHREIKEIEFLFLCFGIFISTQK